MGGRRKRISRLEEGFRGEDIEKLISKSTKDKEEEISRLRELNQLLVTDINSLRQEKACLLQELTQMESHIHNVEGKIESMMENLHGELTEQVKVGEQLNDNLEEVEEEFREQCQRKAEECRADISKQLQIAEERFRKEIFEKEKECRAVVSDKRILESSVLKLNGEIRVISAELELAHRGWKLEKELFSQIVAARHETEEITKGSQMEEQSWSTDKDKLLSSLAEYKVKIEEMSMENERVLVHSRAEKIEMQSRLNEFKTRAQELLEYKHLWDSEKGTLESTVAELQRKLDSFDSERELLSQKNRELSTEVECLKARLNEHDARPAHLEDEMEQNERVLHQCRTEKNDLQSELNESKEKVQDFFRTIEQDGYLWDEEKRNLEATLAELQTNMELMASGKGSMSKKIVELIIEVEFLKTQENEYSATLVTMEDERQVWRAESERNEERLQSLLKNIATTVNEINNLQLQLNEVGVKQYLDLIEQYKVTEHALQQRNEIQQKEVDSARRLLESQSQRVEELETALQSLNKDLEYKQRQPLQLRPGKTKWFARLREIKLCV